ncbi:uncharacterized protein [Mytilus edulis]|uniref:uncharacterized protein n=1 Tax=Mytilus edulis TaxID=6550 RepID=UPI0039F0CDA0
MSHSTTESLHFYKYLCQKIGSEKMVKARRLSYIRSDFRGTAIHFPEITSGSKGEGLDLKGSDLDIMRIELMYALYESEKDAVKDCWRIVLVMDTEDTQPGFTHLQLYTNVNTLPNIVKQNLQEHRGKILLSSELYKSQRLKLLPGFLSDFNIHGPCLADNAGTIDIAQCLKCDQWVSQAQPWISRSRLIWPSPELISKITSCGTLFVPIGNKGSINENLQWRISFSVAEKMLIYSFSHTQLLCYALLKILMKEIVNGNEDLKDLFCSYFLKTLMFWMSEENETSVWRPDNIIPCYMACLKRLLYCIEYSTLLHYFIPNNNFFYLKFNNKQRNSLINFLTKSFQKGIKIFLSSPSLHDYRRFPCKNTTSVCEITSLIQTMIEKRELLFTNTYGILNPLLYHCKTELSRCIFKLSFASVCQTLPFALPHINNPNNKQQYKFYKRDLSQLLVGVHSDAVSGWLKLACFFYGHKNYLTSIDIINYTLSKCTDESSLSKITLKQTVILKLISLCKNIASPNISFSKMRFNSVIPLELKSHHNFDLIIPMSSLPFAHFLRFLCCYHLQNFKSSRYCINKLSETAREHNQPGENIYIKANNFLLLGIAFQMLGERDLARRYFHIAAQIDDDNHTSAAFRLLQLR